MKNKFISGVVVSGFLLVGITTVNADQMFLFSDDLSTSFEIDQSQTMAKFIAGRFFTADDSVSSAIASKIVANPFKAIISARLDVSVSIPSGTRIIYYLSNNKGFRWTQVNPGFTYTFDSVGNELRWRAVIARESPFVASAYIDSVHITYTVSDLITPSFSTQSNSGGLSTVLYGGGGDLNAFVCDILGSLGLGCGVPHRAEVSVYDQISPKTQTAIYSPKSVEQNNPSQQVNVGGLLQASIANTAVDRNYSDDEVILVKVPAKNNVRPTFGLNTDDAIFEIIRGQKHFIPTVDIFFDYGFDLSSVQSVTHKDLELFPRTKLVNIYEDNEYIYYITEGHMIRLIPNDRVFESYGDREEDIITISKKEFNFYPRNQYVFLENPLSFYVYQIVNNDTKRYVTPQVVKRLRVEQYQIAPINQLQLGAYKNGQPIIF